MFLSQVIHSSELKFYERPLYNEERIVSSINGVGKPGQLHAKELNWTTNSHHTQKLTQNGLKT